jgi:hypothetical protein
MDEVYSADGLNVFFETGSSKVLIAEARSESWARHFATALNHWDKENVTWDNLKDIFLWMSRNTTLSPYMQWYWRRLPEVQPVDLDPLIKGSGM